ncbi:MAG TPA: hypothetical protein VG323_23060 [Thermoanaerobaculia bacterium]|nr:hypothetical protein [Thermoanaerobaculia bacterium]
MRPALIGVIVICAVGTSAPPTKPSWQWTIEDRLAARFDVTARNRRIETFEARRNTNQALATTQSRKPFTPPMPDPSRPTDVIQGLDHPELLMPFEIFGSFTRAAYGAMDKTSEVVKQDALRKGLAIGLPPDFLRVLETQAHTFIALQREELQLVESIASGKVADRQGAMARLSKVRDDECASRWSAMENLRRRLGPRFAEFLYTAVAPGVSRTFFEPVSAEQLRRQEEGCR